MNHSYCVVTPEAPPDKEREVVAAIKEVLRDGHAIEEDLDGWDEDVSPIINLRTDREWEPGEFHRRLLASAKESAS